MSACRRVALLLFVLACPSCASSSHYRITLKDGRQFQAASKPEFVTKTGYYKYQNTQGRDALIRGEEVLLIEEEHS